MIAALLSHRGLIVWHREGEDAADSTSPTIRQILQLREPGVLAGSSPDLALTQPRRTAAALV